MISSERYSVGSEDGKSISFQKEEGAFVGFDVTIKFKHVIAVIICAVLIIGGTSYYSSVHSEQNGAEVQDTVPRNEVQPHIDEDGFVFAKSSSEVLSEEMVLALREDETVGFQRLLKMSINEIYARHGQLFNAGEVNDTHYQKYSWYRETNKHGVKWEEFNNFEKTNLRLLISIEEETEAETKKERHWRNFWRTTIHTDIKIHAARLIWRCLVIPGKILRIWRISGSF